jgi:GNAT superfamily N-acetyltransferase
MSEIFIRRIQEADSLWVRALLSERWGTPLVASLSGLHDASTLDGFIAEAAGPPGEENKNAPLLGLTTYRVHEQECEVVTLDSLRSGLGIGTRLLETVVVEAREQRCRRLWVITTNDNLPALRFYQRRGWDLVAVHRDAVTEARATVKPQISLLGLDGIPLRHALELEYLL